MNHLSPPDPARLPPLLERAGSAISSFIRSFTWVVWAGMALALVGLAMKVFALASGNFVFVFALAMLVLLFLVQVGMSFFYVITNVRLALLGAISSLALVLGLLALIFYFQAWVGRQVMCWIALPVWVLMATYMVIYFRSSCYMQKPHRLFLYRNLLVPVVFVLALGLMAVVTGPDTFNPGEEAGRRQRTPVDTAPETDTTDMWRAY